VRAEIKEVEGREGEMWWDEIADEILKRKRGAERQVVATGITPSGAIHIGNLRETLIADAVCNALRERGAEAELIYVADTFDPLRRLYPFLRKEFEEHVGKPLSEIPDPEGCHASYAEHFLLPFLEAVERLGIEMKVFKADEMYKKGMYVEAIKQALSHRKRIIDIIKEVTGRELPPNWSPFNAICAECGRMNTTTVLKYDLKGERVRYKCECGCEGFADFRGGGKLTWRVDWAARWKILSVTVEPFGKDHASAGGSYDTGKRISEEIYEYEAPFPIPFEHVLLRVDGKVEAMSSSRGTNIPVGEMLDVVPPEVLKFLLLRKRPMRHIEFDPALLVNLVDEYEREVAPIGKGIAAQIPFRHFVTLVQVARNDFNELLKVIKRSGYAITGEEEEIEEIRRKAEYASNWLRKFAPETAKFEVQHALPAVSLTEGQKEALKMLASEIRAGKVQTAEEYHNKIYDVASAVGIPAKDVFKAVYLALLGKDSGPRAGWLLASLSREFLVKRFEEAASV